MRWIVKKHRGYSRCPGAFTLVEVVASVLLVGLAIVASLRLFIMLMQLQGNNQSKFIAANLLQAKMEEIKARGFGVDVSESGTSYNDYEDYRFDVIEENPYSETSAEGLQLKKVIVTLDWDTPQGTQTKSLCTLIAE